MDGTQRELPGHWGHLRYTMYVYYGGTYLDIAYVVYAPLRKWFGVATFPAAPIILRVVTFLASLFSLVFLYNFGKKHVGRAAAVVGVVVLLADVYFAYYSSIIHPDSTLLCLAILAVHIAIRHAERGDLASLGAMGFAAGLAQGTKVAGPWLVPMAFLATYWGWQRCHATSTYERAGSLAYRLAFLGAASLLAYFVSTPYAFTDSYYRDSLVECWAAFSAAPLGSVTALSWFEGTCDHLTIIVASLMGLGLLSAMIRHAVGGGARPQLLAAVLSLSNFAWYMATGKLWVSVGYFLTAYGLLGVLGSGAVAEWTCALHRYAGFDGRFARKVILGSIIVYLASARGHHVLDYVLCAGLTESSTAIDVGEWARHNLRSEDRILYDDTAYFDPAALPHAKRWGGILKHSDLNQVRPDYFVLSSSIHDAPWFKRLRQTQDLTRDDTYAYSMRLYQDLLDRNPHLRTSGATGVKGIELVRVIQSTELPNANSDQSSWIDAVHARTCRLTLLARCRFGLESVRFGPTFFVYKLSPDYAPNRE
jgi:hypothetical protein